MRSTMKRILWMLGALVVIVATPAVGQSNPDRPKQPAPAPAPPPARPERPELRRRPPPPPPPPAPRPAPRNPERPAPSKE